jgi:hypothetical protein
MAAHDRLSPAVSTCKQMRQHGGGGHRRLEQESKKAKRKEDVARVYYTRYQRVTGRCHGGITSRAVTNLQAGVTHARGGGGGGKCTGPVTVGHTKGSHFVGAMGVRGGCQRGCGADKQTTKKSLVWLCVCLCLFNSSFNSAMVCGRGGPAKR